MHDDHKVGIVAILALAIVLLSIIWAMYYNSNVLPVVMAEKGYCYGPVTNNNYTVWTYMPCKKVE